MTAIHCLNAETLSPPAGHYSHAVCANGFVFISGLLPTLPDGGKMTGADFATQTQQVFHNLEAILRRANTDKSHLVQVRVYLTDIQNWSSFNQLYAAWIGTPRPARCVVPVPELHYGLALELEAVAAL